MWALLVQRHDARRHPSEHRRLTGIDGLGFCQRFLRVLRHPSAGFRKIQETIVGTNTGDDVVDFSGVDLRAEAALGTLPEKPEHGSTEPTETCAHERDCCTVEELATRYTDGFRIWWRPWRNGHTLRHGKCSAATGYRLALELFAAHRALGFLVSRACLARQHASGFTATRCSKHDNTSEHDESSEGDDKCGVHDLQLEEDSVAPRKGEVVARTAEERANDGEHCPEHQVHRPQTGDELAILGLV